MPHKRPRLIGLAALPLLNVTECCFVSHRSSGQRIVGEGGAAQQKLSSHDEIIFPSLPSKRKPDVSVAESTFWRSVPKRRVPKEDEVIPCNSNLDADGPLPFGAYRTYGKPEYEPKKTCILSVALDFFTAKRRKGPHKRAAQMAAEIISDEMNISTAVRNVQQLIDAGFTSFQVAEDPRLPSTVTLQEWADENVFGSLRKQTPLSVLLDCNFFTKIAVPAKDSGLFGSGRSIREAVGASLSRTGADCIDTVQIPYCKDSPYHLDVLNVLTSMQKEGLIRSISGMDLPPSILTEADRCHFHFDTNQIQTNLLDPQTYAEYAHLCLEMNTKMLCSSPLAGGLLTDRHLQCERRPDKFLLSTSELRCMEDVLPVWTKRRKGSIGSNRDMWEGFHTEMLKTVGDIAYKYQVSVASVVLRWSLHLDNLGSVSVGSRVGVLDEDERPFTRPRELREVFTFELDNEDMKRLWDITGCNIHTGGDQEAVEDEFGVDGFVPDLSNHKLWL